MLEFLKTFYVQTDASLYGTGIVLSQIIEGKGHPIFYPSKKFSRAEQNYSTIERQLVAIELWLNETKLLLGWAKIGDTNQ